MDIQHAGSFTLMDLGYELRLTISDALHPLFVEVPACGSFIQSNDRRLVCMFQDSVPAGSYNDPFLSSVISMVAPTWCHGAI